MVVTNPDVHPYSGMSMMIVRAGSPGITMRHLANMHDTDLRDPLYVHDEVTYCDVRIPVENRLGDEGQAFVLAQKRLGPGRIHHSMRWIRQCRRAFDALCERAVSVSVHGSRLADKQMVQQWSAAAQSTSNGAVVWTARIRCQC
jgi:acyl-CoA dehydrogenase